MAGHRRTRLRECGAQLVGQLTELIADRLVAFDSAPLIYYIEEHPVYLPLVDELFDAFDSGLARGMTSFLTLHEALVKPLRDGRPEIAEKDRQALVNSINVELELIDKGTCEIAARMRAKYHWLRTPDALQIASAITHEAEIIVTNDEKWQNLTEANVVVLSTLIDPVKRHEPNAN